jgi:hypothetical protein
MRLRPRAPHPPLPHGITVRRPFRARFDISMYLIKRQNVKRNVSHQETGGPPRQHNHGDYRQNHYRLLAALRFAIVSWSWVVSEYAHADCLKLIPTEASFVAGQHEIQINHVAIEPCSDFFGAKQLIEIGRRFKLELSESYYVAFVGFYNRIDSKRFCIGINGDHWQSCADAKTELYLDGKRLCSAAVIKGQSIYPTRVTLPVFVFGGRIAKLANARADDWQFNGNCCIGATFGGFSSDARRFIGAQQHDALEDRNARQYGGEYTQNKCVETDGISRNPQRLSFKIIGVAFDFKLLIARGLLLSA